MDIQPSLLSGLYSGFASDPINLLPFTKWLFRTLCKETMTPPQELQSLGYQFLQLCGTFKAILKGNSRKKSKRVFFCFCQGDNHVYTLSTFLHCNSGRN